jgi:hypothetical protein
VRRVGLTCTWWALLPFLAGCAAYGPVDVPAPSVEPDTRRDCAALVAALPDRLDRAVRRPVRPEQENVAAWGSPPVVLRCGVPAPRVPPDAQVLEIDGVAWVTLPGSGGTFWTTVERDPRVEVEIPDAYDPAATVLVDLAVALR